MTKPLCFMIMPYGKKPTLAEAGKGPAEIDFDALWDRAYVPVIKQLGYQPVRADQDSGALIINQMLERLYFSDLVLADMTIANGNVYYEVGIRHAAQPTGCVLLAADWSRQLFDVAQMRTIRYPLPEGAVLPETAAAIQAAIQPKILELASGRSPMHMSIKGYPNTVDMGACATMQEQMTALAQFQARIRAVRAAARAERAGRAKALADEYGQSPPTAPTALALLRMLRDSVNVADDWKTVLDFIGGLSGKLLALPEVREVKALALSNTGQHLAAIAELETVVATDDPSPERLGLLGGRYKRLWRIATAESERLQYLNQAINHYERGMELDLNEYFCSCNLPRLYRQRNRKGDEERAQSVLRLVIAACERAKRRGATDEFLRPTLLGAAFDVVDADLAEELAHEVQAEGAALWKIDSTLADLESSVLQVQDASQRARLEAVISRLKA